MATRMRVTYKRMQELEALVQRLSETQANMPFGPLNTQEAADLKEVAKILGSAMYNDFKTTY